MKNYNTLEGLEKYYIPDTTNMTLETDVWEPGSRYAYYKDITIKKSFRAFAMVNLDTFEYVLRCDPINDEQYRQYELFCIENGTPEWVVLS